MSRDRVCNSLVLFAVVGVKKKKAFLNQDFNSTDRNGSKSSYSTELGTKILIQPGSFNLIWEPNLYNCLNNICSEGYSN